MIKPRTITTTIVVPDNNDPSQSTVLLGAKGGLSLLAAGLLLLVAAAAPWFVPPPRNPRRRCANRSWQLGPQRWACGGSCCCCLSSDSSCGGVGIRRAHVPPCSKSMRISKPAGNVSWGPTRCHSCVATNSLASANQLPEPPQHCKTTTTSSSSGILLLLRQ